jgi:hypothetical protein
MRVVRIALLFAVGAAALAAAGALQSQSAAPPRQSPLAAYPGFGHDPEADERSYASEELQRENLIAACMQGKGFRYTPEPSVDGDSAGAEAFAAGPNERYTASFSARRWRRYSLALAGVPDANDQSAVPNGGCIVEAHDRVPGVFAAYNALREPYEEMRERIAADRRVVAANRRWGACMRARGHAYATPQALVAAPDAVPAPPAAQYAAAVRAAALCERQARLPAALTAATIDHETAFVAQYRDVLERYRTTP